MTPTLKTMGRSARCGSFSRPRIPSTRKSDAAPSSSRSAANQKGGISAMPSFIRGQLTPQRITSATRRM